MKSYTHLRFIGYAIPTEPAGLIPIGNLQANGGVAGYYIGNNNTHIDISARIDCMIAAIEQAKANIPNDEQTINIFLVPEFFFHGIYGPYLWDKEDPMKYLLQQLKTQLVKEEYANWIFVAGSMISTKTTASIEELLLTHHQINQKIQEKCNQYFSLLHKGEFKLAEAVGIEIGTLAWDAHNKSSAVPVQNRAAIINNINNEVKTSKWPVMSMQKKYFSNQDLAFFSTNHSPLITEQMSMYPEVDLKNGDVKRSAFDEYCIFKVLNGTKGTKKKEASTFNMSVDVCLDHLYSRLRQTYTQDNKIIDGKVQVQVFPSCGIQIIDRSVVAGKGGYVFNCDGSYYFEGSPFFASNYQSYKGNIVNIPYRNSNYPEGVYQYGAHTQLAQVINPATGSTPGATDASIAPVPFGNATCIAVEPPTDFDHYFAGGPGELHIYGLHQPFSIPE